ncbi:transketolase C-terminal domain-containing protein [Methanocella arvoryzae]|uniref:Pyruvate:ferredoxin oxidoreductase, alpha subunit n=1 Tax=Methanocella arvoryzae (strain DSM 22066 / NBRC 105507 / MRE50) TaxID=351160 RepID=Q0W6S6_METAR|nr:transketolase C-terminal domain-containing protein [Methanocella arvoryzae]CAJ35917.1 pyruvate:ferredoxin oxidoreductase, alpha subunit [Methanocella arvoryzae MRE50]
MAKMAVMEGSHAIAEAAKVCRPAVVSAYPITPQTHIVEDISQMIANGDLTNCEYVRTESEFSAASVIQGAQAAGARTFSATASQGALLMYEVLFSIAGMRLPCVLAMANRAVSSPINIWNDHQDAISARDSGWIQIWAEDNQEAADMIIQAYKIGEDPRVMLPVMVNMDGFLITHLYEPVETYDQKMVDEFLPPYNPQYKLDPKQPVTMGALAQPEYYTEARYMVHNAQIRAKEVIEEVAAEFGKKFGRYKGGLIDTYKMEGAKIALVAMGSIIGTMKDAVDEMREAGVPVGIVKIRSYRPFPVEALRAALKEAEIVCVLDRNISLGGEGAVFTDLKGALYNASHSPTMLGFIIGLGGRDTTVEDIKNIVKKAQAKLGGERVSELEWYKLDVEILPEGI